MKNDFELNIKEIRLKIKGKPVKWKWYIALIVALSYAIPNFQLIIDFIKGLF